MASHRTTAAQKDPGDKLREPGDKLMEENRRSGAWGGQEELEQEHNNRGLCLPLDNLNLYVAFLNL